MKKLDDLLSQLSVSALEDILVEIDGYEQKPVDIETFVTDPYYLGNYFEGHFRPYWMDVLKQIYPTPFESPYWLVIFRGSIGRGKTTTACVGMAYDTYRLLCLKSPQRYLGVIPSAKIVFAVMNMTLGLATDVVWEKLSTMFSLSPFFTEQMNKQPAKDKESLFPKKIDYFVGSRVGHTLGKDVIEAIIDEANFEVIKEQTKKVFTSLLRRIQSRYMSQEGIGGRIWVVSSESDKGSALNQLVDKYKNKKGVLEVGGSLWEAVPEKYSGETFKVFIGSETRAPEIITKDNSDLLMQEPDLIIDVPIEHYDDFEIDIHASLRDLAGIDTAGSYKLFKLRHRLSQVITVESIFSFDVIQLDFDDETDQIQNYLRFQDYFANPINKEYPRCLHIDIALSGDRLGIASSYVSGFKERVIRDPHTFSETVELVPTVITEWCLGIEAKPGQQIPLYKVRLFISWLSSLGYPIDCITCDGYQSADMIQWALKAGYESELFSVDKTSLPYIQFRNAIYEQVQVIPKNKVLKVELEELEVSPDGKKVDHPDKFKDGTKGSKDIADAVCGSSCVARERADNYRMMFINLEEEDSMSEELKQMFWG